MARYITTKADFTLRKKHKKGSGSTIYENDYTTINPLPNAQKGEYVIGDSNFVFTARQGINGQKKHVRGKFVPNPLGEDSAWTLDTIIDTGITNETKIRLKPNYTSLTDFACYGSATKLIQGTINGVISDFPAEMYLSKETIKFYNWNDGYGFDETKGGEIDETLLYNEYEIDIVSKNIEPENIYNPLRYLALCGSSYTYLEGDNEYEFIGFSSTPTGIGRCHQGKDIWVDKVAEIEINFTGGKTIKVKKYTDYREERNYYTYTGGAEGGHIRPKKTIIEEYFRNCDDFTSVLLDRVAKPIYSAIFETPYETETGYKYEMKTYIWPSLNGGFNPDLSGPYFSYLASLIDVAEFLDEYRTDNIWRSLTHEAIKTLDWTYVSNDNGDIQDMSNIDTSRIEPIAKIYGRQFDDLKRYADGIKAVNTITYNQKSNIPDYLLTDVLSNAGWEVSTLHITNNKDICTDSLYLGLISGYTASDANIEFMRRLKLNSNYLTSIKGTRKGLDTILSMFGFTPEEYKISEYIYVFSGTGNYPSFCGDNASANGIKYPLADEVKAINKYKVSYNPLDPYGEYCGIPVVEVGCEDGSYVIPWYSQDKKYDDGLYFQMNGGWAKRKRMNIDLAIAPDIKEIDDWGGVVPLYTETQARLKFAKDFDELLQQSYVMSNVNDVFYVTDISKITTDYKALGGENLDDASHYFILLNKRFNQFLGFSDEGGYGWRNIKETEIKGNSTTAATLVLFLESIKDDTTGNNPHIGNGLYDDGLKYVSGMSEIFNYSLIKKNFIGINDDDCEKIAAYKFDAERQEDNRKCWFFSDEFEGTTNTLREGDVTSFKCDNESYDDESELTETNAQNKIGQQADGYFLSGAEIYNRTTQLNAFNPETKPSMEASANSIVNVKNMEIVFAPKVSGEYSGAMKTYIENSVMPYLTQMMPSTTIWAWSMSGETSNKPSKIYKVTFRVINGPADSIIYDGAKSGAKYGNITSWALSDDFYEGDSVAYIAKKGNEIASGGKYITGSNTSITIDIVFASTLTFVVDNGLTASMINYTVNGESQQPLTNVTNKTVDKKFKNGDVIAWTATCSDSQYEGKTGSATMNGDTTIHISFDKKPEPEKYTVTFMVVNEGITANITYMGTKSGNGSATRENSFKVENYEAGSNISWTATSEGYEPLEGTIGNIDSNKTVELNFSEVPPTPEPCLRIEPTLYEAPDYTGSTNFTAKYYIDCTKQEYTDVTDEASWNATIGTISRGTLTYQNDSTSQATGTVNATYEDLTSNDATVIIPGKPEDRIVTLYIRKESNDITTFNVSVKLSNSQYSQTISTATSSTDRESVSVQFVVPAEVASSSDFSINVQVTGGSDKVELLGNSGQTSVYNSNLSLDEIDGQNVNIMKYWLMTFCATIVMPTNQDEHIGGVELEIGERRSDGSASAIRYLTQYSGNDGESVFRTTAPNYSVSISGWSTSHEFGFNDVINRDNNMEFWEKYTVTVALSSGREVRFEASDLLSYAGQTAHGVVCTYEELNNSTWIFERKS